LDAYLKIDPALTAARYVSMQIRVHVLTAIGISGVALALAALLGTPCSAVELLGPAALMGTLYMTSLGCERGRPIFEGLAAAVGYTTAYSTLVLTLATAGAPLADHRLAACDQFFGLSVRGIIEWTAAHSTIRNMSDFIYYTAVPQTLITILALGYGDPRRLDAFLSRFMLAGIITAAGFVILPAEGACAYFGLPTPAHYEPILDAIRGLRSGTYPVSWRAAEGVIAFPSFHVTWGVLLIAAYRRHLWGLVFLPLNLLMIASAITSGMHYFVDVAAGLAVGLFVVGVVPCRSEVEESLIERIGFVLRRLFAAPIPADSVGIATLNRAAIGVAETEVVTSV
jgi:membrane-associated phospholipid phosphatase